MITDLRRTNAGTAVGYGDRPAPRQLRLIRFQPLVKNALRGFCTVEIQPLGLRIIDCPVLVSHGRAWCALPGKIQVDNSGRQKTDTSGKPLYAAVLQWRNRELSDRFSAAVIGAIRRAHPGALE
ncbi:MAG: hypothetical protein WA633_00460 [Stellaceae bacterium]